ncbi:hypothetical protein FB446DRAFT_712532 [Lentinula raphanica]|nr:hypothetical protein FB446DRAFT_712532 [Lentinula raphanica]
MAGLPVLQLHPYYPAPQVIPLPGNHSSGIYLGPFMDGWETGRFIVCPHECLHTMNRRVNPLFQNLFIWPVNTGGRSYDHVNNRSIHQNCKAGCPAFGKFGPGDVAPRRPATLAETARGVIQWSVIVHNHRDLLSKRELAWAGRVEAGEDLQNHQLRALWNAATTLPALIPSHYSNLGIGPDAEHLQFQDIPTHLSQVMRPFDVNAALAGLPAMPPVPGSGPVICGYHGLGAPSAGNTIPTPLTSTQPSHSVSSTRSSPAPEDASVHSDRREPSPSAPNFVRSVEPSPSLSYVSEEFHSPSPRFPAPEAYDNSLAGPSTSRLSTPLEKKTSIKLESFEDIAEILVKTEATLQKEDSMDISETSPGPEEKQSIEQLMKQEENKPHEPLSRIIELEKALQSREEDNRILLTIVSNLTELLHLRESELELHKSMIKDLTEDLFTSQLKTFNPNLTTTGSTQPVININPKDSSDSFDDDSSLFNE